MSRNSVGDGKDIVLDRLGTSSQAYAISCSYSLVSNVSKDTGLDLLRLLQSPLSRNT